MIVMVGVACVVAEACMRLAVPGIIGNSVANARGVEKHQVQNLILLCGSGTTGCHGFVHMHPTIAYENGWCVKSFQDQLEVPVRTWHGLVYLTTDGKYSSTKEQSND